MGVKSDGFRAKARQLEERARSVADQQARSTLLETAQRWRELARNVQRDEFDRPRATKQKRDA